MRHTLAVWIVALSMFGAPGYAAAAEPDTAQRWCDTFWATDTPGFANCVVDRQDWERKNPLEAQQYQQQALERAKQQEELARQQQAEQNRAQQIRAQRNRRTSAPLEPPQSPNAGNPMGSSQSGY